MRVTVRAIVAGIPNSGKSTFINAFFGKSKAKTGNKPGVTKERQWIKDSPEFELMDTPGLLWPNLEDERVMLNLTVTNAIKNELYDAYTLACEFLKCYQNILAPGVQSRYGVDINSISLRKRCWRKYATERESKSREASMTQIDVPSCSSTTLDWENWAVSHWSLPRSRQTNEYYG